MLFLISSLVLRSTAPQPGIDSNGIKPYSHYKSNLEEQEIKVENAEYGVSTKKNRNKVQISISRAGRDDTMMVSPNDNKYRKILLV